MLLGLQNVRRIVGCPEKGEGLQSINEAKHPHSLYVNCLGHKPHPVVVAS